MEPDGSTSGSARAKTSASSLPPLLWWVLAVLIWPLWLEAEFYFVAALSMAGQFPFGSSSDRVFDLYVLISTNLLAIVVGLGGSILLGRWIARQGAPRKIWIAGLVVAAVELVVSVALYAMSPDLHVGFSEGLLPFSLLLPAASLAGLWTGMRARAARPVSSAPPAPYPSAEYLHRP